MGGRGRRAAAAPEGGIRYYPEHRVLRPANPAEAAPEFVLEEAVVYKKDGKTIANMLDVTAHGPFIVRGRLLIDTPESRNRLIDHRLQAPYIEIPLCKKYAIGFGDEHCPCPSVWIEGTSGWLEIGPAREYRPMYDQMMEGITLYYRLMDAYTDVKSGKKTAKARQLMRQAPIPEIFFNYAVRVGDGVIFPEVERRCDEHALFLLDQFSKEDSREFDWTCCSFYHYMRDRHSHRQTELDRAQEKANIALEAAAAAATPVKMEHAYDGAEHVKVEAQDAPVNSGRRTRNSRSRSAKMDGDDTDAVSDANSQQSMAPRTRQKAGKPAPTPSPIPPLAYAPPATAAVHDDDVTGVAALASRSMEVVPQLVQIIDEISEASAGPFKNKHTKYSSRMYFMCKIKEHKSCREILSLYAPELLQNLDPAKYKGSPLWSHLEAEAKSPPTRLEYIRVQDIPNQILRRNAKNHSNGLSTAPVHGAPPAPHRNPGARPQYAGKVPALRLSSRKRPRDDEVEGDDSDIPSSVRAGYTKKTREAVQAHPESDEGGSSSEDEDEEDGPARSNVSKVVLRAYPMQTDKPKGPRGTWVCEEDGCGHVVRSADEPDQKALVHEHMRQHTSEKNRLAEQAEEEGLLNGLPIQNLLDKIMKEAKDKKPKPTRIRDRAVPERIKRVGLGW